MRVLKVFLRLLIWLLVSAFLSGCVYLIILSFRLSKSQKARLLIITDPYFDQAVFQRVDEKMQEFCEFHNYRLEKHIVDVHEDPQTTFLNSFNVIESSDTAMLVFSPFTSILFLDNSNMNTRHMHYRPIVLGFGNKLNNSAFDFMFDMDTSLILEAIGTEISDLQGKSPALLLYSNEDYNNRMSSEKFALQRSDSVHLLNIRQVADEDLEEKFRPYSSILTLGYNGLGAHLKLLKRSQRAVLPYYADFRQKGYYCILPDVIWALEYAYDNYNIAQGCQNINMKYRLKYIK